MRNIIAILRGIQTHEIVPIVSSILDCGIQKIEVPLNSPTPYESITRLVSTFAGRGIFGAGTVLSTDQVDTLASIGLQLIVTPHCDVRVIQRAKVHKLLCYPGACTPTECFRALAAGADGIKLFPGEILQPAGVRAIRSVLPPTTVCMIVGGVAHNNLADWVQAGIDGFGIGSSLYKAGDTPDIVQRKASAIVSAYDRVMQVRNST